MAESIPPDLGQKLAEAIRQIQLLSERLAGSAPAPAAASGSGATPTATSGSAVQPAEPSSVPGATFRAPAAVGSRLTVRPITDPGTGAQLQAFGQTYAHGLTDLLVARDTTIGPVRVLPFGGECVVVTAQLPPAPGEPGGSVVRSAFVRLATGSVQVEFIARAGDPSAAGQFDEVLQTLRPAAAAPAAIAVTAGATGAGIGTAARSVGATAFDLPAVFRSPQHAAFGANSGVFGVSSGVFGASPSAAIPTPSGSFLGALAMATSDAGQPVQYELPPEIAAASVPAAPSVAGAGVAAHPTAPATVTVETVVNGHRIQVTGDPATVGLVLATLTRTQPDPK